MISNGMDEQHVDRMAHVGKLAKTLLDYIAPFVQKGISTLEIDKLCSEYTHDVLMAESAPLNYLGFPKSVCTSINNVVCHGIPDHTRLRDGDIINIDVTVKKKFEDKYYYGDTSRMFMIGAVKQRHRYLCDITLKCLDAAIESVVPGRPLSVIGHTIETMATGSGFSVVRDFCGHGIGTEFHTDPQILHYKNDNHEPMIPGMIFTIEPMINERGHRTKILPDGWTAVTRDGGFSAQYEHTVLVTDTGCRILTS
jgi:methionyl aminopeptidase